MRGLWHFLLWQTMKCSESAIFCSNLRSPTQQETPCKSGSSKSPNHPALYPAVHMPPRTPAVVRKPNPQISKDQHKQGLASNLCMSTCLSFSPKCTDLQTSQLLYMVTQKNILHMSSCLQHATHPTACLIKTKLQPVPFKPLVSLHPHIPTPKDPQPHLSNPLPP